MFVLHVCACTRARLYVLREIQTSTTVGITLSKRLDENNRHNLSCLKYRYSFVLHLRNRKKCSVKQQCLLWSVISLLQLA